MSFWGWSVTFAPTRLSSLTMNAPQASTAFLSEVGDSSVTSCFSRWTISPWRERK